MCGTTTKPNRASRLLGEPIQYAPVRARASHRHPSGSSNGVGTPGVESESLISYSDGCPIACERIRFPPTSCLDILSKESALPCSTKCSARPNRPSKLPSRRSGVPTRCELRDDAKLLDRTSIIARHALREPNQEELRIGDRFDTKMRKPTARPLKQMNAVRQALNALA